MIRDGNKSEHILIHPRRGRNEKVLPKRGILLVNPLEAQAVHTRLLKNNGESRAFFNSALTVAKGNEFCAAGPAIGAPMAAMAMEKLVVLGVNELILCGWCGGIDETLTVGDIIIPDSALSGEGTSCYYPAQAPLQPAEELSASLRDFFAQENLAVRRGCVWSTDAIFREDQYELVRLNRQDQVVAVDMEFSALCSVAAFRGIDFAAVLVVSDVLYHEEWLPGFKQQRFIFTRKKAVDNVLKFFGQH